MIDPKSETNNEIQSLQPGERVTLQANGVSVDCVVAPTDSGTCLVPLDNLKGFAELTVNLPAQVYIYKESGESIDFTLTSESYIKAVAGRISTDDEAKPERQWYRIRMDFEVDISVDGRNWHKVSGENISEGGLLMSVTDQALAVAMGQAADVRLHLPDCEIISAHGVVKRVFSMPTGQGQPARKIGLEFSCLKPEDSRHLTQFIYRYQVEHARIRRI